MLSAQEAHEQNDFACIALDLAHGGKVAQTYLGHAGQITDMSTSPEDHNVFVTACDDGYARLYDVRSRLPSLTMHAESEVCSAAVIAHPDGVPSEQFHTILWAVLNAHVSYFCWHT